MKRLVLSGFLAIAAFTFATAQQQLPGNSVTNELHVDFSKSVKVFPNPAVDYVYVKLETIKAENVKVTLHNIIGTAMPVETEVVSTHELRVRVKDLSSGYYLLALKDDETGLKGTYKVLKK
jgi:hypothetical protein